MSITIERLVNGRWSLLTRVGFYEISTVESSTETLGLDTFLFATGARAKPWQPFETMVFDTRRRLRGRMNELVCALEVCGYDTESAARQGHEQTLVRWAPASGVRA